MRSIRFFSLILLLALSLTSYAQDSKVKIACPSADAIEVNGLELVSGVNVDELIEVMGEPDRRVDHPSSEISLFYDQVGVVFFSLQDEVKGLGINFNWDGDEKFPETSYTGEFLIGESMIDRDASSATLSAVEGIGFTCPFPLMCISDDKEAEIKCMAAFEEDKITQIVITME